MYNMNTQVHSATKKTPYEIAFGLRANNGKKNLEIPEDLEIEPEDDLQAVNIPPDIISPVIISTVINQPIIHNIIPPIIHSFEDIDTITSTSINDENINQDEASIESADFGKISAVRNETRKRQAISSETMSKKHDRKRNKKSRTYNVGDYVSVKSPRIDRHGTDLPRITSIVIRIINQYTRTFYELKTEYGILNDKYAADDLEPILTPMVDLTLSTTSNKVSLREVTMSTNNNLETDPCVVKVNTNISCKCTLGCFNDKRCSCFKVGQKCTSHCHGSKSKTAKPSKPCCNL